MQFQRRLEHFMLALFSVALLACGAKALGDLPGPQGSGGGGAGGIPDDGSVTNVKVSSSAAIAGTKIAPQFGAQNITGTGSANRIGIATTNDSLSDTMLSTSGTTKKALVLQGKSAQSANLFETQDSTGGVSSSITAGGTMTAAVFSGYTATQAPGDNTTRLASTAFVTAAVAGGGGGGVSLPFRLGTATTADALADTLFASSADTQKPLVLQATASQSANLFETQNSAGGVITSISPNGTVTASNLVASNGLITGGTLNITSYANYIGTPTTNDALADTMLSTSATTRKALVLQASPLQSANLFEVQDSTGSILFFIDSTGKTSTQVYGGSGALDASGALVVTTAAVVSMTVTPDTSSLTTGVLSVHNNGNGTWTIQSAAGVADQGDTVYWIAK